VLDLGGGTFDCSYLSIREGVVEVTQVTGDPNLGGNDFDHRIVDWLARSFEEKEGIDLRKDPQALQRLAEAAERAKTELSSLTEARISVPFVAMDAQGPKHVDETLTRECFEELCRDLVERIRGPVGEIVNPVNQPPEGRNERRRRFKEVVLVGGSSRIPMFQQVAREASEFKPVNNSVNPEEAVAIGAAVQASMLAGEVKDIMLFDVTPITLGVETNGGAFKPLVKRNTPLPHKIVRFFTTSEDCQDEIEVVVLQGERPHAKDNKRLGSFYLTGIPMAPAGMPKSQSKVRGSLESRMKSSRESPPSRCGEADKITFGLERGCTEQSSSKLWKMRTFFRTKGLVPRRSSKSISTSLLIHSSRVLS